MSTKKVDANHEFCESIDMSPEQVRAARNWLGWTQAQLAERSKVSLSTIKDYESGKRSPIANNVEAIQKAMELAGIEFGPASVSGPLSRG